MSSVSSDGDSTTPFLLRLFYRNGAFHRSDDFTSQSLPPHISVYTKPKCSLNDLALELAASDPSALPSPAIGTRLAFQLVCPDLRNNNTPSQSIPRFAVKDLGSMVIGGGGPGAAVAETELRSGEKTLSDARFVVGDYVSCAVLPPLADGSVVPASTVSREVVPIRGASHRGGFPTRDGLGHGAGRGGGGGGGGRGRRTSWSDRGDEMPTGEWRRGDILPGANSGRGRRW